MHRLAKHFLHSPKEHGGGDPGLGYLRKEEEGLVIATPKKRTNIRTKFGVSNF